ncbi:MAG: hypothetical protein JKY84_05580 [Emcibacteraceae bacterium]|nr:hypothetical protein [Emcibacteraceae bacterium]
MTKAILTSKADSAYDDLNEFRYHFPQTYFNQIQNAINDWIIYYEPRRLTQKLNKQGGRQAYYATARITRIERDPTRDEAFRHAVRNGLALSGTIQWMFDRRLISVDDDYTILTADNYLPAQAKRMLNSIGKLLLPERMELRPHPQFLDFHRENVFKG